MKRLLVACEESQRVCTAFREVGWEAYSCDIIECSGGHPEWHIQQDVLPLLNGNCTFMTMDGTEHTVEGKWDMIIAHPPCTYLTVSGNRWFNEEKYGEKAVQRKKDREEAVKFFMAFINADCEKIAVENPVGVMSRIYQKPNQIIQPYQFGHHAKKTTCLWMKNLRNLIPTNIVDVGKMYFAPNGKAYSIGANAEYAKDENGKIIAWNDPRTAKIRSKTFPGIAKAMAEQWGKEESND